jgi:hypothetical protein
MDYGYWIVLDFLGIWLLMHLSLCLSLQLLQQQQQQQQQ